MRACWREGIVPLLQMHDCLDCSVASQEQGELVARLGGEAVSLAVPMRVDLKFGRSWGDAKHTWDGTAPAKPSNIVELAPAKRAAPEKPISVPAKPSNVVALAQPKPITQPKPIAQAKPIEQVKPIATVITPAVTPAISDADGEMQIDLADLVTEPVPPNRKVLCHFHDARTPSLHIYPDHFYCYGCHTYGDHVDWLVRVEGLDLDVAVDVVENWTGPVVPREPVRNNDSNRTARALELWDAAKPIAGTLAARYLANVRRIDLDALPADIDNVLRFHRHCPFGPNTRRCCLLALMRDPLSNAPTGIQRIALTPDAQLIDRMMFGRAGVAKLWPAGQRLVVGEGLETVLAAATRLPYRGEPLRPAWALLSKGGLRQFPVITDVEKLIVLADHDHNGAGQAAADACMQTWEQAGRSGVRLLPDRPGADFNDVVIEMLERTP